MHTRIAQTQKKKYVAENLHITDEMNEQKTCANRAKCQTENENSGYALRSTKSLGKFTHVMKCRERKGNSTIEIDNKRTCHSDGSTQFSYNCDVNKSILCGDMTVNNSYNKNTGCCVDNKEVWLTGGEWVVLGC